jgi:hypothetical protein
LQQSQLLQMKVIESTCLLCLCDPSCTAGACVPIKGRAARAVR